MPEVIITRLIGIVAVIALVISVGIFSSYIANQVSQDTSRSSLQEVTEKVSSEIIELVGLFSLNSNSNLTYKVIDIPDNINNHGYSVNLQKDSLGWKVVAYLNEFNTIRAESNLYFRGGIEVVNGNEVFANISYNSEMADLICSTSIYSGTTNANRPVIWCQMNPTNITIGLGRLVIS